MLSCSLSQTHLDLNHYYSNMEVNRTLFHTFSVTLEFLYYLLKYRYVYYLHPVYNSVLHIITLFINGISTKGGERLNIPIWNCYVKYINKEKKLIYDYFENRKIIMVQCGAIKKRNSFLLI